ncbi:MAG TPA: hypothetical protein VH761_06605, partial [Ilumatobacteraceae bacterium]
MTRAKHVVAGVAIGSVSAAWWATVAFADNCSSELDCQQTQTYNTTTTVIATAVGVAVAVISILISQAAGTAGAAGAAATETLPPPGGDVPPTTDVIVDGQQAIDILIANGLITPVTRADGSTGYVPTTTDLTDNPYVKGIAWGDNPDGTIDNPVIVVPGEPPTEIPESPPEPPPTEPPPTEPPPTEPPPTEP